MGIRYDNRSKRVNQDALYEEHFEKRDISKIRHYRTPKFKELTVQQRTQLIRNKHVWKIGDNYAKLAQQHYGDPKLWWVLAWYNGKPTDALLKVGDTIRIPFPLERVLGFFGV